jgi:alginate O-acetyltransferase complex protein AlgI
LPLFFALRALAPLRLKNILALLASVLFYAWGEPQFVAIVIGSALLDLGAARAIDSSSSSALRRLFMILGVLANLALLFYFKYAEFAVTSAGWVTTRYWGFSLPAIGSIALPIGVSFIVFEKITYIVDVYRGVGRPTRHVHDYLLYVFLFPKLLAGPIVKYHDIQEQLRRPVRLPGAFADGLTRFTIGLSKKVLIADPMSEISDAVFATDSTLVGFKLAWLGAVAFSLQIFFDFSGYSDMAIGLARCCGFRLMENFDKPYLAVGFADFWRRWHISLSTWIRDYLYIPLGGDRVSRPRLYLNLWICFLASGLWHGAAWTFVVWGAYHGFFLTLDRIFLGRWLRSLPRGIAIAITFFLVTLGWVVFRAPTLAAAVQHLRAMFDPSSPTTRFVNITPDLYLVLLIGSLLCFLPGLRSRQRAPERTERGDGYSALAMAGACVLLVLALAKATTVAFQPFLYFRF